MKYWSSLRGFQPCWILRRTDILKDYGDDIKDSNGKPRIKTFLSQKEANEFRLADKNRLKFRPWFLPAGLLGR